MSYVITGLVCAAVGFGVGFLCAANNTDEAAEAKSIAKNVETTVKDTAEKLSK